MTHHAPTYTFIPASTRATPKPLTIPANQRTIQVRTPCDHCQDDRTRCDMMHCNGETTLQTYTVQPPAPCIETWVSIHRHNVFAKPQVTMYDNPTA